jgi:hypothetical protein
MPTRTFMEIPLEAQAPMLAALRRAVRLLAGPPHFVVACLGTQTDRQRRGAVLFALQCVPNGVGVSRRDTQAGRRCAGLAGSAGAYHSANALPAAVAADVAQSGPADLWLVPHTWELCHTGPDVGPRAESRSPPRRCAAGSTRWAGCGSGRSW